ncbi:elongation factor G-binding protein [Paenibacillus alvei]|uniref:Elongation factor G-binding protein n=1 Tax=Paenibacillus alvei TaxID=44250 RepID=A0ABT4GYX0_PAEAL|nr:elongation factor G-binding protein [Paenibacillus alvei]EJW15941.1 fibronectin-binding family protein [Paenibacillus alvei DSM 29]MCY7482776.1 elongation factor G-binding protein [Paenibacillus alvei]MCY9540055.1 elongation factor G-binding protein [Paenibacillus alvei]MCY9704699.1 elongation factor G-binding protein [Paenibacillus alvei]MCY9732642.1 elongation factor G-binding protein [Paenibacillus alvei]
MTTPFIRNHQYNLIKKQATLLQHTCQTVADPKIVDTVRYSAYTKITEAFPQADEHQLQLLERITTLDKTEEFSQFLFSLEPFLIEFEQVTDKQLKKLFPKSKKLKLPNMEELDLRHTTYLGWTDIGTNRMYLIHQLDGRLVGIEGKFTQAKKKSTCFLCNRQEEVALFTAETKSKPANASSDYYKAIGNYMCMNSHVCNQNITDTSALEMFIRTING